MMVARRASSGYGVNSVITTYYRFLQLGTVGEHRGHNPVTCLPKSMGICIPLFPKLFQHNVHMPINYKL